MGKKVNQFYLSSGLQVLNAIEYIYEFKKENEINEVIVINRTPYILEEIKGALYFFDNWSNIHILNPSWLFKIKKGKLKIIIHALWAKYQLNKFFIDKAELIFGHDKTLYCQYISKKGKSCKQILLDDGTSSLNFNQRLSYDRFNNNRKLIYSVFGVKDYKIKPDVFFSAYKEKLKNNVDKGIILKSNNYTYLKSLSKEKIKSDDIYFIGDLLVERNRISEEEYFEKINYLKLIYENKLIYVSRSSEDEPKLKKIENLCNVLRPAMPFEIFLATSTNMPESIIGYHSSVLFNVYKIYGDTLNLYYIKLKRFSSEQYKLDIEALYQELKHFAKEL